jgi:hypothetical protein
MPPVAAPGSTEPTIALLGHAWRVVMANVWMLAGLSGLGVAASGAHFIVSKIILNLMGISDHAVKTSNIDWLISASVNTVLSVFIVIPIYAGLYGVVFRIIGYEENPLQGFSVLSKKFMPVVTAQLIFTVPLVLLEFVLRQSLSHTVAQLISGLVDLVGGAAFMLTTAAIIKLDLSAANAISYSLKRFFSKPFAFLGYSLGATILSISGVLACGVGFLLTFAVSIVAAALLITGIVRAPGQMPQAPVQGLPQEAVGDQ